MHKCKKLVQLAIKLTNFSEQEMLDILQHKTITDNQITAWINLLKEWYFGNVNRDCDTVLYWAKSHSKRGKYKIGITNNIISRSSKIYFGSKNDCYDYHIIRTLDNRYKCAFIEYMVRVKFCDSGNEYIDKNKLNDVIRYINNFKFTTYYKNKMIELGYKK